MGGDGIEGKTGQRREGLREEGRIGKGKVGEEEKWERSEQEREENGRGNGKGRQKAEPNLSLSSLLCPVKPSLRIHSNN